MTRPSRSRGRNQIALRLAALVRLLIGRRYMPPVADLASELEVTPRTVYRDLVALEAAHWPLPRRPRDGDLQERVS